MQITLPQLQAEIAQLQANYGEMEARQEMIEETNDNLERAKKYLIEDIDSGLNSTDELEESQRKIDTLTENLRKLTELAPLQLQTSVELVDDGYTFHVTLGPDEILFQTDSHTEDCIKIQIQDHLIYLASYYYGTDIQRCPHIPHDVFFKLLEKIGVLYNLDVTLLDASTKQIEHTDCKLAAPIFSLSGKPTFYERFGFVNEEYTEFIKEIQPMPFAVFVKRAGQKQDETYDVFDIIWNGHSLYAESTNGKAEYVGSRNDLMEYLPELKTIPRECISEKITLKKKEKNYGFYC